MKCLVTKLGESIDNPNLENFYTYKYLDTIKSKFSRTITEFENVSLKAFVSTLNNAGILSKVQYMALPMFASNSSEAIQNVLLKEQVLPSYTQVALDNKLIAFNADGGVDLSSQLIAPINGKMFFATSIAPTDYEGGEGKSELYAKFTDNQQTLATISAKSQYSTRNIFQVIANSTSSYLSSFDTENNYYTSVFSIDGTSGITNWFGWKASANDFISQTKTDSPIAGIDRFVMNGTGTSYFGRTHVRSRILVVGNELLTIDQVSVLRNAVVDFVRSL